MADLRHITGGAWEGRGIGIAQPTTPPAGATTLPSNGMVTNGGTNPTSPLPPSSAGNSSGAPVSAAATTATGVPSDGTEEVQRKLEDEQYLRAVEETRVPLEMLAHLPPFEDLAEMEERLRQENRLTFDAIFDEPTGYYSMKCFLTSDYAVDKAIFIKDVDAYKSMRFESARLKVAALLYRRFVSPDDSHDYDKGLSVFEILAASKYRAYDERSMISHASRFMSHVTAAGTTYALTSGIREQGLVSQLASGGVSGGVSMVAVPSPHTGNATNGGLTEGKEEKARLDRPTSTVFMTPNGAPALASSPMSPGGNLPPSGTQTGTMTPVPIFAASGTAAAARATSPLPPPTNNNSGSTPPPGNPLIGAHALSSAATLSNPAITAASSSTNTNGGPASAPAPTIGVAVNVTPVRAPQHAHTASDFKFVVDPPSSTTSITRPKGVASGVMSTTLSGEQSRMAGTASQRYVTTGSVGHHPVEREVSKAITVISKQGGHSLSIGRTNAIGVYGQVLRTVADRVNRGEAPRDLFDPLYREVMMDLKMDAFPRFLRSEFYKRYIQTKFIELQKVTAADFTTFRVLGRGAFGAVHACRKRNSGRIYAMKCVNKRLVRAKSALDNVMEERNALAMLRSPFVTNLKYALQDEDTLYLVMDLMIGGDLKFHLINAGLFPEKRARFYAAQILLGLEHLHQNNVIYRDLKLENVLLDHNGHCRISDLGLAVISKVPIKGYAGTPGYIAPESIKGKMYDGSVDIFSFGVILYRMLAGSKPFRGKGERELDRAVVEKKVTFPKEIFSPAAVSLLSGLLAKNPLKRIGCTGKGIQEIKDHPFFESIDWGLLEAGYLDPPFVPNKLDVNAASRRSIGDFDRSKYRNVRLDEKFKQRLKQFDYISARGLQEEMVSVLMQADIGKNFEKFAHAATEAPPTPQVVSSCCTIL